MFIHLIALAKFDGREFAYHFASLDPEKILKQQKLIRDVSPVFPSAYGIHVLKTERKEFASVQTLDGYFRDVIEYTDLDEFFSVVKQLGQVKSEDVASYMERKYNLLAFPLQKTLYYIYADFLIDYQKPLFQAHFLAYDKGPVDSDVYRIYKHYQSKLKESHELEKKIMAGTAASNILEEVDSGVQKYHAEFDWDGPNPTHNPDSPWQVAQARDGQNAVITDSDILKYHQAEKI
ncbi:DUF4065 domain-containing protein [Levilactobacillus brevis]|nr:DUF4065 domain-containing protein [Levilactobacillus brevis]